MPTHKGSHTRGHAFTEYATGERELYDLTLDPYQLNSRPRAGNEAVHSAMETRLYNLRDCTGSGCRRAEWTSDATPPSVTATSPGASAGAVVLHCEQLGRGTNGVSSHHGHPRWKWA